jgi:uncharacterized protein (DUF4213/DUF364 family)
MAAWREWYDALKARFRQVIEEHGFSAERIEISSRALSPEEAIGNTVRKDFPLIIGKESLLQAEYRGAIGQAFTDSPAVFSGTLKEILDIDIVNDRHGRGLFIASLNAVMRSLSLVDRTVHCKDDGPELCAQELAREIRRTYGSPRIALVGFQPALLEHLSKEFELQALDLNPDNIGATRHGKPIRHGSDDYKEVVLDWAELVLCTGSTLVNGTIINYLGLEKDVIFFGVTMAGAAELLGLKRWCVCST